MNNTMLIFLRQLEETLLERLFERLNLKVFLRLSSRAIKKSKSSKGFH